MPAVLAVKALVDPSLRESGDTETTVRRDYADPGVWTRGEIIGVKPDGYVPSGRAVPPRDRATANARASCVRGRGVRAAAGGGRSGR